MNKLKVIQLLPELNVGGVERGTTDFSKALVENGHEDKSFLKLKKCIVRFDREW